MDKHTRQFRVPNPGWQLPRHVRDSVEHRNLAAHLSLLKKRLLSTYERAVGFASKSRKFRRNLSLTEMRIVRSLRASRELVIKPADKTWGSASCPLTGIVTRATGNCVMGITNGPASVWHICSANWTCSLLRIGPRCTSDSLTIALPSSIAFHLNTVLESCDTVLASTASIVTELRAFANPHDGDDVYLVTADVSDMYNNIPVNQAISAVGSLLLRRNFSPRLVAAITAALELVLNNNYFSFDGGTYRQTAGIAMGTPCAPPLAQLFVAVLEEDLRVSLNTRWPSLYKRYIDDSIAIFKGLRAELDSFLSALQAMHPNLHWTFVVSQKAIAFLDLTIWLGRDGRLGYSVHTKALNAFQYIPPYSFHAPSVARGWILTELFRIRRNSSTELARLYASLKFFKRLRKRGYTASFLSSVFTFESARQGQAAQAARRSRQYLVLPFDRTASVWPYKFVMREWYDSVPYAHVGAAPGVAFRNSATLGSRVIRAKLPRIELEVVLSDSDE